MRMLVELRDNLGFRAVELDGLFPIGTPIPFCAGAYTNGTYKGGRVQHGKVVGYGNVFRDGLPYQQYLIELDEHYRIETSGMHLSMVVVHPECIIGSVQCDPDAGGCGCEFRMDDSVLHRWSDGELSWMCRECADRR